MQSPVSAITKVGTAPTDRSDTQSCCCHVCLQEVLQRRLACVFGSSKERSRRAGRLVTIDFVVAGQVAAFRNRERMSSVAVQEMPVHVPDVFA